MSTFPQRLGHLPHSLNGTGGLFGVDDTLLFINWRQGTFALSQARFTAAVDFLHTARGHLVRCDNYADGDRWLQRDESGFHQLWLYGVGFYLAAPDLQRFMELCERAAEQLAQLQPVTKRNATQQPPYSIYPPTTPVQGFSIN